MVVSESPDKVQQSSCHGRGKRCISCCIHHSAKCVQEIAKYEMVFTKQVKRVYRLVKPVHQWKEEQWCHTSKPVRYWFW